MFSGPGRSRSRCQMAFVLDPEVRTERSEPLSVVPLAGPPSGTHMPAVFTAIAASLEFPLEFFATLRRQAAFEARFGVLGGGNFGTPCGSNLVGDLRHAGVSNQAAQRMFGRKPSAA